MTNVSMTSGIPTTVLPAAPAECLQQLASALELEAPQQIQALRKVTAMYPRVMQCWAELGERETEPISAYAFFRVGYHRGLDAVRASGWKGSGYVRWAETTNQGFLRCLAGLGRQAAAINELDEAERVAVFCAQLDPDWIR
jgi:hypothetical protein